MVLFLFFKTFNDMKKIILLLLLLCLSNMGFSQNKYFEKNINFSDYFQDAYQVILFNDFFYLKGGYVGDMQLQNPQTDWAAHLICLNKWGDTLFVKRYELEGGRISIQDMKIDTSGIYMVVAQDSISDNYEYNTFFMRTDFEGNVLQYQFVGDSVYSDIGRSIVKNADGTYIIGGEISYNDSRRPYAIKLDANGNVIWRKTFTQYWNSEFNAVDVDSLGNYYFFGTNDKDLPMIGQWLIVKTDTAGNTLEYRVYYLDIENAADQILYGKVAKQDNSLLLCSCTNYWDCGITKLDTAWNIVWRSEHVFKRGGSATIEELPDGSIVSAGNLAFDTLQPILAKISSSGETMWQRRYGPTDFDYLYGLARSPDGGYLAVGRSYLPDIEVVPIYMVKTNCMGLLTEPAAAFTTYQTGNSPLEVAFANASQYVYPDSIDGGHYVWDFGDGSPPFVCGQGFGACPDVVLHSYAAQGQYTASLRAVVCSDTSQVEQSVVVLWNGTANPDKPKPLLHLMPNPANNTLYLTLSGAAAPISGIWHLYDATGRQVRQSSLLVAPQPSSIPIADLPEGIYIWQFYTHNTSQAVQSGKISILRSF
jgi:hypothetical protein